jgi:hypothetical protein
MKGEPQINYSLLTMDGLRLLVTETQEILLSQFWCFGSKAVLIHIHSGNQVNDPQIKVHIIFSSRSCHVWNIHGYWESSPIISASY